MKGWRKMSIYKLKLWTEFMINGKLGSEMIKTLKQKYLSPKNKYNNINEQTVKIWTNWMFSVLQQHQIKTRLGADNPDYWPLKVAAVFVAVFICVWIKELKKCILEKEPNWEQRTVRENTSWSNWTSAHFIDLLIIFLSFIDVWWTD